MPIAVDHASGAAFDGRFYVFGGRQCGSHTACEGRADVQIYDTLTDTWSLGAPMLEACSGMGSAVVLNGRVYVIGGEGGSCTGTAVQEYDPSSDSWRLVADLPTAQEIALATTPPDDSPANISSAFCSAGVDHQRFLEIRSALRCEGATSPSVLHHIQVVFYCD